MYATRNDKERQEQHNKGDIVKEYVVQYSTTQAIRRQKSCRSNRDYECKDEFIAITLPLMLGNKRCNGDGKKHYSKWYHHP
jgi:hypothetical protein